MSTLYSNPIWISTQRTYRISTVQKEITCRFNSRKESWMFRIDWKTGLSRTEIKAFKSAPTCRLFRKSSVCLTLVCTSFKSSRAARVSLEIGILISGQLALNLPENDIIFWQDFSSELSWHGPNSKSLRLRAREEEDFNWRALHCPAAQVESAFWPDSNRAL